MLTGFCPRKPEWWPKLLCRVLNYKCISETCKSSTGHILEGGGQILKGTGLLNYFQPVWAEPCTYVFANHPICGNWCPYFSPL